MISTVTGHLWGFFSLWTVACSDFTLRWRHNVSKHIKTEEMYFLNSPLNDSSQQFFKPKKGNFTPSKKRNHSISVQAQANMTQNRVKIEETINCLFVRLFLKFLCDFLHFPSLWREIFHLRDCSRQAAESLRQSNGPHSLRDAVVCFVFRLI